MGIKTGFNEAFLIDTPKKESLVRGDPKSAALFKRYLRGQDIQRWHAEWNDLWMLALKSSGNADWPWSNTGDRAEAVFAETYPAIYAHLNQHRDALVKRQDQGEHWWELRACAYWDRFDGPKIMYQDIAWQPRFCMDLKGELSNNTVYFLPTNDLWTLAALNSPISWWYAWRNAQHGKDEALRFFTTFIEFFPIPAPQGNAREEVSSTVNRLKKLAESGHQGRNAVLDWLRVEFGVAKPSQKLTDVSALDSDGMIAEVKKVRGRTKPLSVADMRRLKEEHGRSVVPLQALSLEALGLERRIAELVNAAYGLTPDEVRLMWATVPPRMPVAGPL